jgi:transmembrane sensor
MTMSSSRQIELIASAWLARRDAEAWSEHDQAQLDAWFEASIAHRVAYLRLESAWLQSDRLKALGAGVPAGVVPARGTWGMSSPSERPTATDSADGTPHAQSATHIPRQQDRHARNAPRQRAGRLLRYAGGAFVLALVVSFALGWRHYSAVDHASYHTTIGGLLDVPLADGSLVTLSSDSRILVTLSRGERRIDLQQGEAFFRVAKDASRPFVVSTGDRRAIAVGTRYDVRRDGADLRVIVTEGLVRLESNNGTDGQRQPTTLLPAGSIATATKAGVMVRSDSVQRVEEMLNWRSGFISFHDTPLTAVAAEFNRYNSHKIVIGDASVGALRVGGNFRWANADTFVRLLEQGFPLRAVHGKDTTVLKSR